MKILVTKEEETTQKIKICEANANKRVKGLQQECSQAVAGEIQHQITITHDHLAAELKVKELQKAFEASTREAAELKQVWIGDCNDECSACEIACQ